jgi:hypothetical protein
MARFAKIIELDNDEQVLLTVDYNDEDDNYEVNIRTDLKGVSASIKLGFKEESKASSMLEKYKKTDATEFRKRMETMLALRI